MAAKKESKERPVLVCTEKRGVFFGYASDTSGSVIELKRSRMCVYWSRATKGVLGLAAMGPQDGSRIGPSVPSIELRGITCVVACTPEAVSAWESGPWAS